MWTALSRARRRGALLITGAALIPLLLVGCGQTSAPDSPHPAQAQVGANTDLYVSVGDSYAAGYMRLNAQSGATTENGFAYQLVAKAAMAGRNLQLVNFGCAGQTSTQVVAEDGCQQTSLGPGAQTYADQPQAAAALELIKAHADQVKLITVVIGGNDVQTCLTETDPATCVQQRLPVLEKNLGSLVGSLKAAAPQATIVGLTYPDAYLGAWVKGDDASRKLATDSRVLFRDALNPTLKKAYGEHGATFADITQASGGYGSMDETTALEPYGTLPTPVAKACQSTNYCTYGDVHPTVEGYAFIADQVLTAAQGG